MADNVTVSNAPTSVNPDIPVRSIDKGGEQTQVVTIDWGGAGVESLGIPDFATETTLSAIETTVATEATLLNINSALSSGLQATINSDVLGVAVTGQRNNEVEVSFFSSFNSDVITNTTVSSGSASITGGHARYRTGTNTTGAAKGVSVHSCKYRPAHEQYVFFTAAFTTGAADSYQRIGLYDSNNGFFLGYEGTSFGVSLRTGAADTFTARASWNGDALDGSSGSKFTRGGTPEAINLTYSNLYRIRFAWLGSASIFFEVFSPDGAWVVFHTIKIPNSQLNPSIQNPELPITIDIAKTAGASDLSLYTACVAAGTTSDAFPINETLNQYSLAKLTRSVITGETTAGGGGFVNVKVNPSGALAMSVGDIDGVKGQETMANSLPVVIASNQTAIPITDNAGSITVDGVVAATQSGSWNINNISGTVSLPTGAATETTLAALNTKVTTCNTGAVTVSSALPAGTNNIGDVDVVTLPSVTLASQANPFTTAIPVTGSISISTTGLATDANQATEISYLTSIDSNIIKADTDSVTLASQVNPFTSAIPVSDNGSSITVDGTIAATQSGSWTVAVSSSALPSGAATESTLSGLNGKVTACDTGAVTISTSLPAGTNNIGDVDVITLPNVTLASQLNPFTSAIPISDNAGSITVDGTVAATQSGTWNITNVSGTISLPTGAATENTLAALDGKVTACNTGAVTISTALPAGSNNIGDVDVLTLPNVTLASQGNPFTSAIPISDNAGSITVDGTVAATQSGTWNINNISGTVSLPTGAATESTLSTLNGKVTACNTGAVTISAALPAGTNNIGDVDIASMPSVVLTTYSTSSVTSVTSAATSTSILASNASRRMAIMVNDSNRNVYVKLGTTASTTSFSYKLAPAQTLELPSPVYTGAIDAIWEASPTGSMRVTEIS